MARSFWRKRTYTFAGRQEPGPCECPVCHKMGEVKPHGKGEKWTTFVCPRCGWYQVPTMNARQSTMFDVVVMEVVEGKKDAEK